MRAINVGTRNSEWATWQASMLVSSLLVAASSKSALPAPASSSTRGLDAGPITVRISSCSWSA